MVLVETEDSVTVVVNVLFTSVITSSDSNSWACVVVIVESFRDTSEPVGLRKS